MGGALELRNTPGHDNKPPMVPALEENCRWKDHVGHDWHGHGSAGKKQTDSQGPRGGVSA